MRTKGMIAALAALALAVSLAAQSKPNLSGTWTLDMSKSDFGLLPGPASRTDVIEHAEPAIKVTSTQDGQLGKQTAVINYTTDGKESTNQQGPLNVKSTTGWEGANLVINSKFNYNDSEVTMKNVVTLSADGRTLTHNIHFTSAMGETDQKLVFEKGAGGAVAAAPAGVASTIGAKPNFTGTWKLNVNKSDFGVLPPSNSRTDVIDHSEPALKVHTTDDGAQGQLDYTLAMTTDGKEAINKAGGQDVKNTANWLANGLVVTTKLKFQDSDVTIKSTWLLAEDGKTLTENAHLESMMGETDQKLVFDKQ